MEPLERRDYKNLWRWAYKKTCKEALGLEVGSDHSISQGRQQRVSLNFLLSKSMNYKGFCVIFSSILRTRSSFHFLHPNLKLSFPPLSPTMKLESATFFSSSTSIWLLFTFTLLCHSAVKKALSLLFFRRQAQNLKRCRLSGLALVLQQTPISTSTSEAMHSHSKPPAFYLFFLPGIMLAIEKSPFSYMLLLGIFRYTSSRDRGS